MSKVYPNFKMKCLKGRLIPMNEEQWNTYLMTMPEEVNVSVVPYKKYSSRSNEQNRYYWGCVLPLISEATGYPLEEVHEICKRKFLLRLVRVKDEDMYIPKSTTELNTVEMEEYLKHIREWASLKLETYIPLPGETVTV